MTGAGQHQPSVQLDATILVFDNGRAHDRSRIAQIEPPTRTVVRQHGLGPFCEAAGGCQRLADGTILISDAQAGRGLIIDYQGQEQRRVQVTTQATVEGRSRAEFYRLASLTPSATTGLGQGDHPARTLAAVKVAFHLGQSARSSL